MKNKQFPQKGPAAGGLLAGCGLLAADGLLAAGGLPLVRPGPCGADEAGRGRLWNCTPAGTEAGPQAGILARDG